MANGRWPEPSPAGAYTATATRRGLAIATDGKAALTSTASTPQPRAGGVVLRGRGQGREDRPRSDRCARERTVFTTT